MMVDMISRADVDNLCLLSRIQMTDGEKDALARDLGRILGYVEQIRQVEIPDTIQADYSVMNITRPDEDPYTVREFTDAILAGMPEREGDYLKVKKVVDTGASA